MLGNTNKSSITGTLVSTAAETAVVLGPWHVLVVTPDMPLSGTVLIPQQVHGGNIVRAIDLTRGVLPGDGVVVEEPGVMVGISTADCVPMIITSDRRALALHISRKTLVHGLLDNALTYINPAEINHIYLGPHICEYHFGFGEEGSLLRQFRYRYPTAVHFHKGLEYLSLRKALQATLREWDIHQDKIYEDGRCTFEHPELPSYRRFTQAKAASSLQALRIVVWRSSKPSST
jgi:polyphenol oxidase